MDQQADVGLVDTHAEGDGGGDDGHLVVDEPVLRLPAHLAIEPGVIGQRVETVSPQDFRQFLRPLAGEAVDDGGLPLVLLQQVQKARIGVLASAGPCK